MILRTCVVIPTFNNPRTISKVLKDVVMNTGFPVLVIDDGSETAVENVLYSFEVRQALQAQMDAEGIDLWVCPPAFGPAPEGLLVTGDPAMNMPWTNAGMPALTVPAGKAENGLPLGLQLVARFERDEELLVWAEEIAALCASL